VIVDRIDRLSRMTADGTRIERGLEPIVAMIFREYVEQGVGLPAICRS
jgi:hypothetical protein